MNTKKRHNRAKEILSWWYNRSQSPDLDRERELQRKFTLWIADQTDSEQKQAALQKLFDAQHKTGSGEHKVSEEELRDAGKKHLTEIEKRAGVKHQDKLDNHSAVRLPLRKTVLRVAAVLIPISLIAGGIWFFNRGNDASGSDTQYAEFTVAKGQAVDTVLADNTKVWVNADSKLVIAQTPTERVAELSGESYFVVTKDEHRPFVVKTQDLTVTVLGTEFNVVAYPGDEYTTVTLNTGRVTILTHNNESYNLEPNQQFTYHRATGQGAVKAMDQVKAEEVSQWKQGTLVIDDITINEALKIIGRRYNIDVVIGDNVNLGSIMMGKFESDATLEDVMYCIKTAYPNIKYTITKDSLIVN